VAAGATIFFAAPCRQRTTSNVILTVVQTGALKNVDFYKQALGATEVIRMPAQDGKRLMHSEINVAGARIFVMDDFPEHRGQHGVDAVFPPDQI
jgi:PhnB protein